MKNSRTTRLAAALLLLAPMPLAGQDVASMVVRVQDGGVAVADVPVAVMVAGQRRLLATTGSSGIAAVGTARVPLRSGARVRALVVICGGSAEVLLLPDGESRPVGTDACRWSEVGTIAWGREDRLLVQLGQNPQMRTSSGDRADSRALGGRVRAGVVVSALSGDEIADLNSGFGGEVQAGLDFPGGFGIGAGAGVTVHGLEGADENLTRWVFFLEPRLALGSAGGGARPYLSARAARNQLNYADGAGLLDESGWSYGGGLGLVVDLARGVFLDISAQVAVLNVEAGGFERSGTELRFGASLGL